MNTEALVDEIEARAAALPSQNAPALRALRREYSKKLRDASATDALEVASTLLERRRVSRFVADELVAAHPAALRSLDRAKLEGLGAGIASWGEVDSFACYLSGPAWRESLITDEAIVQWARSADRWWRRAALVSTVPLNVKARGGRGHADRTLMICSLLVDDRDDMVVKALSWALRALSQRDPAVVRDFVAKRETRLAPRVRREVARKLATGLKNPKGESAS